MSIPARGTDSEKIEPMGRNPPTARNRRPLLESPDRRNIRIGDRSARRAYQMVMRAHVAVKPVDAGARLDHADKPAPGEKSEVSIDGTEADGGKFLLEPIVKPGRRRMGSGPRKNSHERRALS